MIQRLSYKKRKPVSMGDILKEVVGRIEVAKSDIKLIEDILKDIMPKEITGHIKVHKKMKSRLVINIDNPAWLYEASKYKRGVLEAVQQQYPQMQIEEVLFRMGKVK